MVSAAAAVVEMKLAYPARYLARCARTKGIVVRMY
jgi:hypothetical protein